MQDPSFGFGRFNQGVFGGGQTRIIQGGFGGGQTRVIRHVAVSNDPPTQLSSLDPFLTSRFRAMLPTTHRRFFDDDDDDDDDFRAPFQSKVEPPKALRYDEYYKPPPKVPPRYDEYYKPPPKAPPRYDEYYKPPPRANPPGGYYGDGFYPPGGNPVNVHVNLHGLQAPNQNANGNANENSNQNANSNHNANTNHNANSNHNSQAGPPVWLQYDPRVQGVNYNPNGYYDSQTGWRQHNPQVQGGDYNPNGYYNSQTGGGQYNPQVQGGNKVDGDGKITMGSEIGNINMGGGKAGGVQAGGGNYNANSNYNGK